MAKSKGKHVSDKAQYGAYKTLNSRDKNRAAKLARHAKKHPNDKQAAAAKDVTPYKTQPSVKGNYPKAKDKLRDPVTGQPVNDVSYANWDDPKYDPIPPKKGKRNAKTS